MIFIDFIVLYIRFGQRLNEQGIKYQYKYQSNQSSDKEFAQLLCDLAYGQNQFAELSDVLGVGVLLNFPEK